MFLLSGTLVTYSDEVIWNLVTMCTTVIRLSFNHGSALQGVRTPMTRIWSSATSRPLLRRRPRMERIKTPAQTWPLELWMTAWWAPSAVWSDLIPLSHVPQQISCIPLTFTCCIDQFRESIHMAFVLFRWNRDLSVFFHKLCVWTARALDLTSSFQGAGVWHRSYLCFCVLLSTLAWGLVKQLMFSETIDIQQLLIYYNIGISRFTISWKDECKNGHLQGFCESEGGKSVANSSTRPRLHLARVIVLILRVLFRWRSVMCECGPSVDWLAWETWGNVIRQSGSAVWWAIKVTHAWTEIPPQLLRSMKRPREWFLSYTLVCVCRDRVPFFFNYGESVWSVSITSPLAKNVPKATFTILLE